MLRTIRPDLWFLVLLIYFAAQLTLNVIFRTQLSGAEMELLAVRGGQPPLYYCLLHGSTALFGETVAAFAVMKNALMLVTCVALFKTVLRFGRPEWAWVAILSIFFLPQLSWVAQHNSSVADLSMALNAVTIWAFSALMDKRSIPAYVAFGLATGLAALTSVAALFFSATLILAAASIPRLLPAVFSAKMAIAIALAVTIGAAEPIGAQLMAKNASSLMALDPASVWQRLDALHVISQAVLEFGGFLMVGVILLLQRGLGAMPEVQEGFLALRQTLLRQLLLGFILFLAYLMATGPNAASFEAMRPFLITIIPLSGLYLSPLIGKHLRASISRIAIVVALVVLAASPSEYGKSNGEPRAWYLEFRAGEGARSPLL